MLKVVVVEDEELVRKGIVLTVDWAGAGCAVVGEAANGEEGLEVIRRYRPDLIVTDIRMPKLDGIEVCQRIREKSNVPIIMLTAKGDDMDKILGLEYGADDYMTKPFNILEVKARIKTILRRMGAPREREESNTITVHDLSVNQDLRSVTLKGKEVNLTAKEFDMLRLFITNRGKVYNREQLLEALWSNEYAGDLRTVDVHIRRLREKIEPTPSKPEYILTKWGVGYYFTDK